MCDTDGFSARPTRASFGRYLGEKGWSSLISSFAVMTCFRGNSFHNLYSLAAKAAGSQARSSRQGHSGGAEWGADFEVVGDSPLNVWGAEKQRYDSLNYRI